MGGTNGLIELGSVVGDQGRETTLVVLRGPLDRGDRLELTECGLHLAVGTASGRQWCDIGWVGLPLLGSGDDGIGAQPRLGQLDDRQQLACQAGFAGFGGQQLADGDELSTGLAVGVERVELVLRLGGRLRRVEHASCCRQGRSNRRDVGGGCVERLQGCDVGAEIVDCLVGGAAGVVGRDDRTVSGGLTGLGLDRGERGDQGVPDRSEFGAALCRAERC